MFAVSADSAKERDHGSLIDLQTGTTAARLVARPGARLVARPGARLVGSGQASG